MALVFLCVDTGLSLFHHRFGSGPGHDSDAVIIGGDHIARKDKLASADNRHIHRA